MYVKLLLPTQKILLHAQKNPKKFVLIKRKRKETSAVKIKVKKHLVKEFGSMDFYTVLRKVKKKPKTFHDLWIKHKCPK